eukprot:TRINITY_DN1976_c0_g1_i1.p1 TRINITY_DN1976_c0_g1~~TRINITY_DN1976_c0_g1_i1.p1  ORF type:complete len:380 (+),score=44.09 TRINITY_DN1976_c0_g1_i1:145-1284(+)
MDSSKIQHLVLDANPLLNPDQQLYGIAEKYYSTPTILAEIRNQESLFRLEQTKALLGSQFIVKMPEERYINLVKSYAFKSGDIAVISENDIHCIALTLELSMQMETERNIRFEPPIPKQYTQSKKSNVVQLSASQIYAQAQKETQEEPYADEEEMEETNETEELFPSIREEDFSDWITPENLNSHLKVDHSGKTVKPCVHHKIVCMTGDFAMQNVLIGMNLRVMGDKDFKIIKKLRRSCLRCTSCGSVEMNPLRKFCGKCGYDSLIRQAYWLNSKGEMRFPKLRDVNTRGTIFSRPLPKGGRISSDTPITREWELLKVRPHEYTNKKKKSNADDEFFDQMDLLQATSVKSKGKNAQRPVGTKIQQKTQSKRRTRNKKRR